MALQKVRYVSGTPALAQFADRDGAPLIVDTATGDIYSLIASDTVRRSVIGQLATDKLIGRSTSGTGAVEEITCTAAGRALIDDTTAAAQATTLGLGTGDTPTWNGAKFTDNIVLPKTSGTGIKIDTASPTMGWRDITQDISVRGIGGTDPAFNVYINGIRQQQFSVNDECFLEIHIPHDWDPTTDLHIHAHWSHNATTVTGGSVTWAFECTTAKGFNQAAFAATVTPTAQQNASTTRYQHMIAETQLTAASPSASQIARSAIEVDGVVLCRAYLSANAMTVSGGGVPEPFLHFVDLHYQTTNIGTKNKAYPFYT